MRVVADANVLVSAALARSPQAPSALTLDAALTGRIDLITSPHLLQEIAMVLTRPRLQKYPQTTRRCGSSPTSPPRPTSPPTRQNPSRRVSRSPRRLPHRPGHSTSADLLVTGDHDLLTIDPRRLNVEIITPRELIDRLGLTTPALAGPADV